MLPNNQGRHCSSCQKTVVDFTGMTDAELVSFFTKHKGNLCGRFDNSQLQRDILMSKKQINWMRYFFQIALPAFFLSSKVAAQTDTTKTAIEIRDTTPTIANDSIVQDMPDTLMYVDTSQKPTIIDSNYIEPKFKNLELPTSIPVVTTEIFQTLGFTTIETTGAILKQPSSIANLFGLFGKKTNIPISPSGFPPMPTATLFPNPIKSGTVLHINWENADAGDYYFIITDGNGAIVQTGSFSLAEHVVSSSITLKDLPSSNYTLVITHAKSAKKITQQFIVF